MIVNTTLVISQLKGIKLALLPPQMLKHNQAFSGNSCFGLFFGLFFFLKLCQADLVDPFLCHWMHKLLFVLATLCCRGSSVKTLVTIIALPMGRLTGGLQVKWCQVSSLTCTQCPRAETLSNALTGLIWSGEIAQLLCPGVLWLCIFTYLLVVYFTSQKAQAPNTKCSGLSHW